jgi:hypothetical protein
MARNAARPLLFSERPTMGPATRGNRSPCRGLGQSAIRRLLGRVERQVTHGCWHGPPSGSTPRHPGCRRPSSVVLHDRHRPVAGGRAQDDRVQRREARGAHGALRRQPAIPYTSAEDTNEVWDLDNLIKPTLDAMEGVSGPGGSAATGRRPCGLPNGQQAHGRSRRGRRGGDHSSRATGLIVLNEPLLEVELPLQPWSAFNRASARSVIRVPDPIAPAPPGAWRLVSSAFSARSAAARDRRTLATSRTWPS